MHATVFMANDAYASWVESFLKGFRKHNPELPLVCIPYSDDMDRISELALEYQFSILDYDFSALEDFAEEIFPTAEYKRKRLRKLACFDIPVDEFLYIDVDVLVLQNLHHLFGHIREGELDLLYLSRSPDFVYKKEYLGQIESAFNKPHLFSTGGFVSSRHVLSTDELMQTIRDYREYYQEIRADWVFDQPVVNFAFHAHDKVCAPVESIHPEFAGNISYDDTKLSFDNGEVHLKSNGRKPVALHWAGGDESKIAGQNFLSVYEKLQREGRSIAEVPLRKKYAVYKGQTLDDHRYGDDYLGEFRHVLKKYSPAKVARVLEWGSGSTTRVLFDFCKERSSELLLTMDNNAEYLESFRQTMPEDAMLVAKYLDLTGTCQSQSDTSLNYSTYPLSLGHKFDVIYIDGRRRMECALTAAMLCHRDTLVILHDYRRARYQSIHFLFDTVFQGSQFRVFKLKEAALALSDSQRENTVLRLAA